MLKKGAIFIISVLLFAGRIIAGEPEDDVLKTQEIEAQLKDFKTISEGAKNLKYETGTVTLKGGLATVVVPRGYKYLGPEGSRFVLEKVWGNPPDDSVLGMLFLSKEDPLNDTTYAVVFSYSDDGYIEDGDAKEFNYDDLLKSMQKDTQESNEELAKQGYAPVELLGWASEPYYDDQAKKLHWAKELEFEGSKTHTLNYDVRILGRYGYLSMNIVSDMQSLDRVKKDMKTLIASTNFTEGNRYEDYKHGVDKLAAYGIGALVTGKVLAKAGFFAVLLKFGKFILAGLAAVGYAIRKFFLGEKEDKSNKNIANHSEQE